MSQNNYFAPDGFRYGIMFNDGSVGEWFNGSTQREKCEHYVEQLRNRYTQDRIHLVRRTQFTPWAVVK